MLSPTCFLATTTPAGGCPLRFHLNVANRAPRQQLQGFQRLSLQPGESQPATFTLTRRQLELINDAGERILMPGTVRLAIGGGQPNAKGWNGQSLELKIG